MTLGSQQVNVLSLELETHDSTMFNMAGHHDEISGADAGIHVSASVAQAICRFEQLSTLELYETHEGRESEE